MPLSELSLYSDHLVIMRVRVWFRAVLRLYDILEIEGDRAQPNAISGLFGLCVLCVLRERMSECEER